MRPLGLALALAAVSLGASGCVHRGFFTDGTSVSLGRADRGALRSAAELPPDGPGYTTPALWVDANQQNYKTLYPAEGPKPAQPSGFTVMKIGLNITPGPASYIGNNKPHFNLHEAEKDPKFNGQNVVQDDHMWAQAIWGYEKNLPPYDPNDKGHFHIGTAEWWIILEGQIRHNIETVGDFTSNMGDVVYAPPSTWHATRLGLSNGVHCCRAPKRTINLMNFDLTDEQLQVRDRVRLATRQRRFFGHPAENTTGRS